MSESEASKSAKEARKKSETAAVPKPLTKLIVSNLLLLGATQLVLVFIVPVFAAMFADFGAKMPTLTQVLIDWTSSAKRFGCMDPLRALFFVSVAICAAKGVAPRTWLKLTLVFQTLLLFALIVCLFLPIFQLGAVAGELK